MDDEDSFWIEERNGEFLTPVRKKRKYKHKKKEYVGWGSTSLITFLKSIGKDTSKLITQSEVTEIINEYVRQKNLTHPTKKKRIVCDHYLHLLFGRKTIGRLKIHDLLESHFADNCEESSDDLLFNTEDDEDALATCETKKTTTSERKTQSKKQFVEKPSSCFADIIPCNIKLIYLKRSLVEELLKDPETFETKVTGSFIRIRCDPNDFLQKNSHQLLQVTGIKKGSGMNGELLLQVSGFIKDISIHMLSDDNFSEGECEDLHQRVKDGLLKRLMIVDIEQKARVLHEDMTKHWLARELDLLEHLIDLANEKGWRRELDEYLRRREKLQNPDEQERLLHEVPQVVAEDLESESMTADVPDKSVENNLVELRHLSNQASFATEVPKAVANGFTWKATKLDGPDLVEHKVPKAVADDFAWKTTKLGSPDPVKQESNSPKSTPDVQDKNIENNVQELRHLSKQASLVTEVPKAVADGFAWNPTKLGSSDLVEQKVPKAVADDFAWKTIKLGSSNPVKQESNSPKSTPNVQDKNIKNNVQELRHPCKQASLVTEVPKAVADGFAWNPTKLGSPDLVKQESNSPKSILSLRGSSEVPLFNMAMNGTKLNCIFRDTVSAEHHWYEIPVQKQQELHRDSIYKNDGTSKPAESNEAKVSQGPSSKHVLPTEVIDLSDDDEKEEPGTTRQIHLIPAEVPLWHYRDPQGDVQGPFPLISLQRWSDAGYFSPDFKVWKTGQSQGEVVLLVDILNQYFPG